MSIIVLVLRTTQMGTAASATVPQTVDKPQNLSFRTSDRCHWCGNPHPKNVEISTTSRRTDCHNQCAHWFRNDENGTLSTLSPDRSTRSGFSISKRFFQCFFLFNTPEMQAVGELKKSGEIPIRFKTRLDEVTPHDLRFCHKFPKAFVFFFRAVEGHTQRI